MVSPVRFSGLASGLDTESIIKELMSVERTPLTKAKKQLQYQIWQRERYREINTQLTTFREKTVFNLKLQSSFIKKKATSENESVATVKSVGKSTLSSYKIEVKELATPSTSASAKFQLKTDFFKDANTSIGKLMDENYDPTAENPSVTYNMKFTITGATPVQSKEIEITADDSLSSIVSKINSVSNETGVRAVLNMDDQSLTFISTKTGSASDFKISGLTFSGDNLLGIQEGTVGVNFGKKGAEGNKLKVEINGIEYEFNSNTFTFDGIEYSVKQIGTTNVNLTNDEDAFVNTIKDFVEKYNEILTKLNKELTEKRYRDYQPLSSEEKEEMSEKQIELWEEKAKSGLLRNDTILSSLVNQMRTAMISSVDGVNLASIGITTAKYSAGSTENGTLVIDEEKLRQAFRENPDAVINLFTSPGSDGKGTGLAVQLDNYLKSATYNIEQKAGKYVSVDQRDDSSLGSSIGQLNDRIKYLEDLMTKKENQYYTKYAALEKAISQMNSQTSYLSQFLTS